ncbi:glycosidase [Sphingomonas sp. CJ99]
MTPADDWIILSPGDIDLGRSPLRRGVAEPTHVLGAFNPALTRLPSGNLLLMVRVAEALTDPVRGDAVRSIRWTSEGYRLDDWPVGDADLSDPRTFALDREPHRPFALTSLSWLLPVELSADGSRILKLHYDRAVVPEASHSIYGLEDPRIARIGDRWFMTSCCVSPERHGTVLHLSDNGLDWRLAGLVLDHQNKDMALFEGRVDGRYCAVTRPLGSGWLAYPPESPWLAGPSINLAASPDALHWKPDDRPFIRPRRGVAGAARIGGGPPPVLTREGWLILWHGVQSDGGIGTYRTYWALAEAGDPGRLIHVADDAPLIEPAPALTRPLASRLYLPSPVVFSTGMVDGGDHWLVASGEADLACRLTRVPKGAQGLPE